MSLYKELDYSEKVRDVAGVQFSVISPDEIRKRSVVSITQTILYDSSGEPVIGGLFDPRMGVLDHGKICPTDGLDNRFCPGYFGHIAWRPTYFIFNFFKLLWKLLKGYVLDVLKLLTDANNPEILEILNSSEGMKRFNLIIDKCSKVKICGTECENGCGAQQPSKFSKDGLSKIYAEWKDSDKDKGDNKQLLTAEFIQKIFRRISDADCEIMGLSPNWCRPEWLLCEVLPVSPPSVRPSVRQFNNQRSEDDITHKLIDIIKTNNHLKKKIDNEKSLEK